VCAPLLAARRATDRAAAAAGHRLERRVAGAAFTDQPGRRIAARVGAEEAGLIGQDHQRIGVDQVRDQRAERVVVAELDLVGHDRVVLVDDRHDGQAEQRQQRRARVQVAAAIGQVGVREQHLRSADAMGREAALVRLHESHLADCRCGLQLVHRGGTPDPAEPLDAFGDRAGRDQDDFLLHRA
jgi:kynureninase